ncbi:MAG: preQ(1) synthase [Candidatus Binataceae bacterium]|nr:preQ(1) synthase [Candidatus Binataceae bacterium]
MVKSKSFKALSHKMPPNFDRPDPGVLERFESPFSPPQDASVRLEAFEFTSLCPITGQPDWGTIEIEYCPGRWCVESKSLKLYLMGFRQHGSFHEACISRICDDLVRLLEPQSIQVIGKFNPRGGIRIEPRVTWKHS